MKLEQLRVTLDDGTLIDAQIQRFGEQETIIVEGVLQELTNQQHDEVRAAFARVQRALSIRVK